MDKQKQIEEMAKDIYWCKSCDTSFEENCGLLAYELYNAGYRKIPENAVVLTETETVESLIDLLTEFDEYGFAPTNMIPFDEEEFAIEWKRKLICAIVQIRKETAEKFALLLKAKMPCEDVFGGIWHIIDETVKELTEGYNG